MAPLRVPVDGLQQLRFKKKNTGNSGVYILMVQGVCLVCICCGLTRRALRNGTQLNTYRKSHEHTHTQNSKSGLWDWAF